MSNNSNVYMFDLIIFTKRSFDQHFFSLFSIMRDENLWYIVRCTKMLIDPYYLIRGVKFFKKQVVLQCIYTIYICGTTCDEDEQNRAFNSKLTYIALQIK